MLYRGWDGMSSIRRSRRAFDSACRSAPPAGINVSQAVGLWVPKTCATWADALRIAVGSVLRSGVGLAGVSVSQEMG